LTAPTLAILAGGEGSRMGKPKGELRIGDEPILVYLLRRIAWDGPTLLVTAPGREHPPGHELFVREVVDPVAGQGPLRGVMTALEQAATEVVVVATVDMPGVGGAQLRWLVEALGQRPDLLGVMARRGERGEEVEPFPSAFRRKAGDVIARALAEGNLSVQRLCGRPEFLTLPAPREWAEEVWRNLNFPDDLAAV